MDGKAWKKVTMSERKNIKGRGGKWGKRLETVGCIRVE
jgi:hypothetical protein